MVDFSSFQNSLTEQAEKLVSLSSEAFKWNSQYVDAAVKRQSQFFSDLNEANRAYVKSLREGDSLSDYKAVNEDYAENFKTKITGLAEDSTAAVQKLQEKLTSACTSSVAQPLENAATAADKRTAKKAA